MTMAGFWLGSSITGIDTYLLPIIAVVVVISLIPVALELRKLRRERTGERPTANSTVTRGGPA